MSAFRSKSIKNIDKDPERHSSVGRGVFRLRGSERGYMSPFDMNYVAQLENLQIPRMRKRVASELVLCKLQDESKEKCAKYGCESRDTQSSKRQAKIISGKYENPTESRIRS